MPTGRLPENPKEVMPALLLLVTATELAVKAFWIRDEKPLKTSHSLVGLYEELDPEHKQEVERRFPGAESNLALSTLGADVFFVRTWERATIATIMVALMVGVMWVLRQ